MELLVAFIINWLSLTQDISIEEPPKIEHKSPESLQKLFGAPVWALYDHTSSTLYLATNVDLETIYGVSVLVHELVHHYQNEANLNKTYSCLRESEALAYKIQKKFLKQNGVDISKIPELDGFTIMARSTCPFPM